MSIEELIQTVKDNIDTSQIASYDGFIAIQINVSDIKNGVFYIEIKDRNLHVEPYDYYDRNALLMISSDVLSNVIKGRLDPVIAFTMGKFKIDGNPGKLLELLKFAKH